MYRKLASLGVLCALCFHGTIASAEEGRSNLLEVEKNITVESYNPTYPDIQLGYAAKLAITEGGVVQMDSEQIQANLNADGFVYIEAVKGDGDMYFVLEKGGYLLSILARDGKLISENGAEVLIQEVDWLYGRNGLADHEGFKSNLVPQGFLPKTALDEDAGTEDTTNTRTSAFCLLSIVIFLILKGRKEQ